MSKPAIGLMGYDVLDNSACKGLCLIGVSVVGYLGSAIKVISVQQPR
ncbi:hypothetical protein BTURTLESOX_60 [bacterium endosymbiont of Bathymodiolus sp. 5 South]|jgi:hypothetical protein|nr:hypothetical protein [uncultured Gammaproteobacteria bacterium]SHN93652.1 hypothetical protein BCLUESOX_830 [bacterium endosymbiont of Bathymodiolus sp. 5 South]CAC9447082.1 hypothetical protein [uncultured Gammaproteobacteria bacterium]CAC9648884.1 hypothetical protein [uncultured Gammaproteobacteria bacterium]SSC07863.1 hypothetical protein BTURTLESOX_60 [bacterium endosymbiont of Bathymodiolus sp. 5 South]